MKRSRQVAVEYWDERGPARAMEAQGWYARILQHEIDHLHGRLYIDRMEARSFRASRISAGVGRTCPIEAVRKALGLDKVD